MPPNLTLNLGARWLLPEVEFSQVLQAGVFQCIRLVVLVLLMTAISNFDGLCVSDNPRLGPPAGYGGLNHHDVYGNGGPNLIWKQGLLGEEGNFHK